MSRNSIFEKRWLDLVFDGRNKTYGAYQLRLESPKTTLLALLYGILFVGGISGAGFALSSFGTRAVIEPEIEESGPVIVDFVHLPEPVGIDVPKVNTPKLPETEPESDWRLDPVIAKPSVDNVEPTENPAPATPDSGNSSGITTTGTSSNGSGNEGSAAGTSEIPDDRPAIASTLDKRPMFPGGMEKFYEKIARNFEKPDLYENSDIRIILSFVVEKDGSMTDIRVISKTDASLEKEAIRVLKSINKKWEPGVKNGKNVRALFTLPILIKPQ